MPDRIIAVFHSRNSTPGKVGERLVARGFELDTRTPCHGDSLPEDLSGYAAAVVFGGPQSANDDHDPGIRAELDWIEGVALPSGKPVLGICLGAQQIARVLGARVGLHPGGLVEIGYYEVRPTGHCPRFLPAPTMFYQWQKVFFEQGASAFAPKQSVQEKQQAKKIAVLQAKLTTKNEVLSELMEEHIFLKKSLGET